MICIYFSTRDLELRVNEKLCKNETNMELRTSLTVRASIRKLSVQSWLSSIFQFEVTPSVNCESKLFARLVKSKIEI